MTEPAVVNVSQLLRPADLECVFVYNFENRIAAYNRVLKEPNVVVIHTFESPLLQRLCRTKPGKTRFITGFRERKHRKAVATHRTICYYVGKVLDRRGFEAAVKEAYSKYEPYWQPPPNQTLSRLKEDFANEA